MSRWPDRADPDRDDAATVQPSTTDGLTDVELREVTGGRWLTATTTGSDWQLVVDG